MSDMLLMRHGSPAAARTGKDGTVGQGDRTPYSDVPREIDDSTRDDAAREGEATLTAAILRIGASLDLDTVLREVVESARALTGAAYGVIATADEAGQPRDFVTSGMTEEQHRTMDSRHRADIGTAVAQCPLHCRYTSAPVQLGVPLRGGFTTPDLAGIPIRLAAPASG